MKCELFYKYKKSKSEVREALRAAFDEYESSIVKQIENDIDVDQKSVWTILNKRKQKSSIMQSLGKKGTLVTDSNEILNVWQEHFETIFSKSVYLEMIYLTVLYIQQM
jgi:CTP-dependent riboflavin kinase